MLRPSRALALCLPVLALGVLLGGCGDGDEDSLTSEERSTRVAFASWADDVNRLCRSADQALDDLPEPQDDQDYATLEDLADQGQDVIAGFVDDVEALGRPDRNAAAAARFLDTYRDAGQSMGDLADAAAAEDSDAVTAAADAIEADGNRQDRLAEQLGLDDCWEPDDTTDTTDTTAATGLALSEWQTQVDAACAALNPQYNASNDIEFDPSDVEAARPYATGLNAFMTSTVAEFDRIGAPAEQTGTAQELYEVLTQMQSATQDMVDAVDAGDLSGASSAEDRFLSLAESANPLAEELGVPSCGGF